MTSHPASDPYGIRDQSVDGPVIDALTRPGPDGRESHWLRRLLEWSATSVPVALLLLAGVAFGPRGINLLTADVLLLLDPVVPVALAGLGVLVGLSVSDRHPDDRRVFAAASLDAVLTMFVVSAGIAVTALAPASPLVGPFWTLTVTAGICAASSLTLPTGNPLEPRTVATRVVELGVLLPIVAGGFALAGLRAGSFEGTLVLVAQATGVTLALAAAASLLLMQTTSKTEERVLTVSALLLVGGVAGALALSGLFGGLVAGVFWPYAGRHPRETIGRDVLFVQHPLLVLVLLVAGARTDLSGASVGLGVVYLALRVVGRLAGGMVARRAVGANAPRDLGFYLLPPGVFGVAFAINVAGVVGADASVMLGAVVVGTIGSELVAILLPRRRTAA